MWRHPVLIASLRGPLLLSGTLTLATKYRANWRSHFSLVPILSTLRNTIMDMSVVRQCLTHSPPSLVYKGSLWPKSVHPYIQQKRYCRRSSSASHLLEKERELSLFLTLATILSVTIAWSKNQFKTKSTASGSYSFIRRKYIIQLVCEMVAILGWKSGKLQQSA